MKLLRALIFEPGKKGRAETICDELHELQKQVGGPLEAIEPFDDEVAIICNEEGKLRGLPYNRPLRTSSGTVFDVICGNFLIVGAPASTDTFESLSDGEIAKYKKIFDD